MGKYDASKDINEHMQQVRDKLFKVCDELDRRAGVHDLSKLYSPEKEIFDEWTPKLQEYIFGSDEYKNALKEMGEGLKHHYEVNRHHPEHFKNGIDDMNLIDLLEMLCDWMTVAEKKNVPINWEYLGDRFDMSDKFINLLKNTELYVSSNQ